MPLNLCLFSVWVHRQKYILHTASITSLSQSICSFLKRKKCSISSFGAGSQLLAGYFSQESLTIMQNKQILQI